VVQALVSGGYVRTYRVHLPPQTAAGRALPVILNFHALASNGFVQEGLSGLVPLADREGLIVVSPDGLGAPTGWNALMNADSGVDDVQFVADLIARLKQDYCVDTRAVYATGFSNGAMLAARVGCRLSHMIAAIVPVAGVYAPPSSEICLRPVPILAIHGMHDTVVPFDGGLIIGTVPYEGARQAVKTWAGRNPRCEQAVDRTVLSPGVALESYRACSPSEVGLLVLENVGHAPPDETSSPELMWSFMRRHQLPR
jgi:polyhydroxybutyrate depolymerase